ncbi:MAG: hypothetical protein BMS9Abin02_0918 [Anaerolineae bacterium]|nr:MAG: hypothetical protein BMS9Abin02_0918 [Anaerolineae bacterium]
MPYDRSLLVLGGAGLVGSQIVRETARELLPERIIVASLFRGEVREFLHELRREFPGIEFVGAWGDIFVRDEFSMERRRRLLKSTVRRAMLFEDLFGDIEEAYKRSAMAQLILRYKPDVIVDCINTATAISYQDVESVSKKTRSAIQELMNAVDHQNLNALRVLGNDLERNISTLLISQSSAQLIRHAQLLHKAMCDAKTRLYLKVGTTGTGGMGLNIPYTHSEDRPSSKLMRKNAMAFAHTGLLFLMARTPDGPLVKELKPAAMIGYRKVSYQTIKSRGRPQMLYESQEQKLENKLTLKGDENLFHRIGKLQMAGVDTGENGFFARGEFETITHLNQMEFVTPEEIAHQVVLEIKGSNTGYDLIAAVDSAVMTSSFRAGVLRQTALDKLARIESETNSHSVALGQLGPPELSKLLYEAHLLKLNYSTLKSVIDTPGDEIVNSLFSFIQEQESLRAIITSIGLPILLPDGKTIIRGPRINIPENIHHEVTITDGIIDLWAGKGWVDLRLENIISWQKRFRQMQRSKHMLHTRGTSSITIKTYLPNTIEIGAVVAWIFNNEVSGYRFK